MLSRRVFFLLAIDQGLFLRLISLYLRFLPFLCVWKEEERGHPLFEDPTELREKGGTVCKHREEEEERKEVHFVFPGYRERRRHPSLFSHKWKKGLSLTRAQSEEEGPGKTHKHNRGRKEIAREERKKAR